MHLRSIITPPLNGLKAVGADAPSAQTINPAVALTSQLTLLSTEAGATVMREPVLHYGTISRQESTLVGNMFQLMRPMSRKDS